MNHALTRRQIISATESIATHLDDAHDDDDDERIAIFSPRCDSHGYDRRVGSLTTVLKQFYPFLHLATRTALRSVYQLTQFVCADLKVSSGNVASATIVPGAYCKCSTRSRLIVRERRS